MGDPGQYETDSVEAADFRVMSDDHQWWQSVLRAMKINEDTSSEGNVQFLNRDISFDIKQVRDGLLDALRQNMKDVSAQLRYAYLTDQEAIQRGMDLAAMQKLRQVKDKLVKIYQNYGGYEDSIRKAVLTGMGNGYSNFVPVEASNDTIYADRQEYYLVKGAENGYQ